MNIQKIGLGGSCNWCTEAIFRSLKGVTKVKQGWISSDGEFAVQGKGQSDRLTKIFAINTKNSVIVPIQAKRTLLSIKIEHYVNNK